MNKMKKCLVIILIVAVMLSMVSCNHTADVDNPGKTTGAYEHETGEDASLPESTEDEESSSVQMGNAEETEPIETENQTSVSDEETAEAEETIEDGTENIEEELTEESIEISMEESTEVPTEEPTEAPTEELTEAPTEESTEEPTEKPTEAPTEESTEEPTETPTEEATEAPHYHDWKPANCTSPKTCQTCGQTEGTVSGHNWKDATCTVAKTCSTCGITEGNAAGHSYDNNGICTTCGLALPKETETLGLAYELNLEKNGYTVTGIGTSTETHIVIPETYNGLPVTKVADMAFYGIKLESLVVPSSVLEIGSMAFDMCNIGEITLNEGLRIIGSYAFTSYDEEVSIPSTVIYIGNTFYTYQGARSDGFSGITFLGDCPEFSGDPFYAGYYYLYDPATEGWPAAGGEIYSGTFYPIGWKQDVGDTTFEEQRAIYNQSAINLADTLYLSENIQWAEQMRIVTDNETLQLYQDLSDEICSGMYTKDEKMRAIFEWVTTNLTYDMDYLYCNITKCLTDKRAVCSQYALICIQLMRLQDIPAVYVSGALIGTHTSIDEALGDPDAGHAWLLAHDGERWISIDPTTSNYDFDGANSKYYLANTVEGIADIRNPKRQYNISLSHVYTERGIRLIVGDTKSNNPHVVTLIAGRAWFNGDYDIDRQYIQSGQLVSGWFTTPFQEKVYCLSDGRALYGGTYLIDGKLYTFDENSWLVD
ncbi:MAG: leucine-rich repeat protein [Lachnospiraceae bacterium]|nr:leucine-rich repeat protein [Lachnospiraceae bacterium]